MANWWVQALDPSRLAILLVTSLAVVMVLTTSDDTASSQDDTSTPQSPRQASRGDAGKVHELSTKFCSQINLEPINNFYTYANDDWQDEFTQDEEPTVKGPDEATEERTDCFAEFPIEELDDDYVDLEVSATKFHRVYSAKYNLNAFYAMDTPAEHLNDCHQTHIEESYDENDPSNDQNASALTICRVDNLVVSARLTRMPLDEDLTEIDRAQEDLLAPLATDARDIITQD